MKKMLLLLASLACFGMLVSCSDETQDVNVTNYDKANAWYGTVTGTITSKDTTIDSVKFDPAFADVSYTDKANYNGNYKTYTITVHYAKKITGDSSYSASNKTTLTIKKISDKYYDTSFEEVKVEGSLEGSEFTITSVRSDNFKTDNLTFTSLKFTRA